MKGGEDYEKKGINLKGVDVLCNITYNVYCSN